MARQRPETPAVKVDPTELLFEVEKHPNGFSLNRFRGTLDISPHTEQGRDLSIGLANALTFLEDNDFVSWTNVTSIKLWTITKKGAEVLRRERSK